MLKSRYYLLPLLLVSAFILDKADILHISYLHIKSYELKLTNLDFAYIPGEVYFAGETVSANNYEDANIAFRPDYDKLLKRDLKEITDNRTLIDRIDSKSLEFYSGPYQIKLCLDHKKVNVLDSSLFKKTIYLDIVGQYELWDKDGSERLFTRPDQKFWIRDSIIVKGRARREFVDNKIDEIWLAQLTEHSTEIINYFEAPLNIMDKFYVKAGMALRLMKGLPLTDKMNFQILREQGFQFLQSLKSHQLSQPISDQAAVSNPQENSVEG